MLAFVNRIDRPEVNVDGVVETLAATLGCVRLSSAPARNRRGLQRVVDL
jgi:hypothetical protein